MDPNAMLDKAAQAIAERDWPRAADFLEAYLDWRNVGGAAPSGGDTRGLALAVRLAVMMSNGKDATT